MCLWRVEIKDQNMTLINVYNLSGKGADLLKTVPSEAKGTLIMGGDFNLVMSQKVNTQSRIKHQSEQTAILLRKAQIELHPQEKAFTFYSDAHKVYSRLDYITHSYSRPCTSYKGITLKQGPKGNCMEVKQLLTWRSMFQGENKM